MGIIATLSIIAIVAGGVITLGILACTVYMMIRWHREDRAAAREAAAAPA